MPKLTGNCLCGAVRFEADGDIAMQGNCHCTDCQQVSGSPFATLVFMESDNVEVTGELKSFSHTVDSGNQLTKEFCTHCGSQMFAKGRPGMIGLRAGSINEKEHIQPQFNVYAGSKLPCTLMDDDIPAFDKMPG
ncbi:GFA family protein [Hellea balneolensis]|uniref:GFA family protein n=1 Tax=Hellea balneolensis TaxID=287478 RepID=UPI000426690E|nr:GFA family protein [Hellea balneolensis]